jgi:hypothetical protein
MLSDVTLCLDLHDARTGALVASAALPLHDGMLPPPRDYGGYRSLELCSTVAQLALQCAQWPQEARLRLLALRSSDGAVARVLGGMVPRTDFAEGYPYPSDEDEDEDEDEIADEEEEDEEAEIEEDFGDGSAEEAVAPPQRVCYQASAGFRDDEVAMDLQLFVNALGRSASVELRMQATPDRLIDFDFATEEELRMILIGLVWVTPSISTHGTSALARCAARLPTPASTLNAAVATVLATPDVLGIIVAHLPWSDRASAALTCAALAAAVHAPYAAWWRTTLQQHVAPALSACRTSQLAVAGGAAASLFSWRSLAAAIAVAQQRSREQAQLLTRGSARSERRWQRADTCDACRPERWRMKPCALCEAANDEIERGFADDVPAERLSAFVFFLEVTLLSDAADAAPYPAELLFSGACVMPRSGADGNVGSGLHEATALNVLHGDDVNVPAVPESIMGIVNSYAPREVEDRARTAAVAWAKRMRVTLTVQRRSDGAVALLCKSREAYVHSFDVVDTKVDLCPGIINWSSSRADGQFLIHVHAHLAWCIAGAPRTLAQHFPSATLRLDATQGLHCGPFGLVEEHVLAILSSLDWALSQADTQAKDQQEPCHQNTHTSLQRASHGAEPTAPRAVRGQHPVLLDEEALAAEQHVVHAPLRVRRRRPKAPGALVRVLQAVAVIPCIQVRVSHHLRAHVRPRCSSTQQSALECLHAPRPAREAARTPWRQRPARRWAHWRR